MTRMRGQVSVLVLLVSVSMTLISMGSLVYVIQQIPVGETTVVRETDFGSEEDGGFADPSLPGYWGQVPPLPSCDALPHFDSSEALVEKVGYAPTWRDYYMGWPPMATGGITAGLSNADTGYSSTNNQVEGVDEADVVKTDGAYVYTASGNTVTITEAYPPGGARVLVRIPVPANVVGLFVNGDRLVILTSAYGFDAGAQVLTRVQVWDISTRTAPRIAHDLAFGGLYEGSRMIDDYVYVAATGTVYNETDGYVLPSTWTDGTQASLTYADVGFLPGSEGSYSVILLVAFRVTGEELQGCIEAILSPAQSWWGRGTMYVSLGHVFLGRRTMTRIDPYTFIESSSIYRFAIDSGTIEYRGSADVPGQILNQFAMDEHETYLRVATSTWNQGTNVYVLDGSLEIRGRLEGLAPGETMHSARFLGDRVYLVTFKKIDPFFVVDLSDATSPRLLGELKIPGFSDYLHPYDENHVIGLGKHTVDMGTFAWFQGVKLSLFDVSDMTNPREVSTLVIGDRGTESEVARDHRAFLLDQERGFLVLPIALAVIDRSENLAPPPSTYGERVWQGAYVISVNSSLGFRTITTVSHEDPNRVPACFVMYGCNPFAIRRSLYIGDYLYTVSGSAIRIHEIGSFQEVGQVPL